MLVWGTQPEHPSDFFYLKHQHQTAGHWYVLYDALQPLSRAMNWSMQVMQLATHSRPIPILCPAFVLASPLPEAGVHQLWPAPQGRRRAGRGRGAGRGARGRGRRGRGRGRGARARGRGRDPGSSGSSSSHDEAASETDSGKSEGEKAASLAEEMAPAMAAMETLLETPPHPR